MQTQSPTYFDYMATTPLDPNVFAAMKPYLTDMNYFGNPSSNHYYGMVLKQALDEAALHVATYLNVSPYEIIWTSGATESINTALKGVAYFYKRKGKHIITSQIEHKAVLATLSALEEQGYEITYLKPDVKGHVSAQQVASAIRQDTILVSLMHVNNEIGVIQNLQPIGELTKAKGIIFHVDAAQSPGKARIDCDRDHIDLLSVSAHKVYGPKGIGALYIRNQPKVRLMPLIHGGGQQHGVRSGTLAVPLIIGMGEAFRIAWNDFDKDRQHVCFLRDIFLDALTKVEGVVFHGDLLYRVPHNLNFSVKHIDGESLLAALQTLAVSTASACSTGSMQPSHVIKALGVNDALAHGAIRLTIGRFSTKEEVENACVLLKFQINRLRQMSPFVN